MNLDAEFMRAAIGEARLAMGRTHPNPAVGAVVVHEGKVVAAGHTQPAGQAHAEVMALREFSVTGIQPDASTALYVTLEPCSTSGRTPPCTEAILGSGIRTVVIGCLDPNPHHAGRAIPQLESAGLTVRHGVLEPECRDLNLVFNWQMEQGSLFVAAKIATTLDGFIATRTGSSKWITGPAAREDVHAWRRYFPAIAVGGGTVLADDPALTARVPGDETTCGTRFIFDKDLVSLQGALPRVCTDAWKERTVFVTDAAQADRARTMEEKQGLRFWIIEDVGSAGGLSEFAGRCREAGIHGLYLEGGARLLSCFLRHRMIHYLFTYRAPVLLGDSGGLKPFAGAEPASMGQAIRLKEVRHATFGEDVLTRGFVVYP